MKTGSYKLRHYSPEDGAAEKVILAGDCALYTAVKELPEGWRVLTVCPETEDVAALMKRLAGAEVRVLPGDGECCAALRRLTEGSVAEEKPAAAPTALLPEERRHTPLARLDFYRAEAFSARLTGDAALFAAASEHFPTEADMLSAAKTLHSRVVYAHAESDGTVSLRLFAPEGELAPDAPAVMAGFAVLRDREHAIVPGTYIARTREGFLQVNAGEAAVWMESAPGLLQRMLTDEEAESLAHALLLEKPGSIRAALAGAGNIVLLEASSEDALFAALPGGTLSSLLSAWESGGVYLYFRPEDGETTAICRFFAPDGTEERVSGGAAGLLGWWLHLLRRAGEDMRFRQGKYTVLVFPGPDGRLFTGGDVALSEAAEHL